MDITPSELAEKQAPGLENQMAGAESKFAELLAEFCNQVGVVEQDSQAFRQRCLELGIPTTQLDSWMEAARLVRRLELAQQTPTDVEPKSSLEVPQRIGRFELRREVGRGGFGVVYEALDPLLGRRVALKLPRAETLLSPELRQRFLAEAKAAASLDHPHVVPVYEAGEVGDFCYIASAFCSGDDMARFLAGKLEPVAPRQGALWVAQLADAVEYSHRAGIIHRDIKPSNVMLTPRSGTEESAELASDEEIPLVPRLTDFGLAKVVEQGLLSTRTSVMVGTPLYMAPEQALGDGSTVGPAADIYALGTLLYELITLRPSAQGTTVFEVIEQVRSARPIPPRRHQPRIARDLETICLKCLEKLPADRYATAAELAADLRRYLAGEAILARPVPTIRRVWEWTGRAERMRDAGTLVIVINMVVICWMLGLSTFTMSGISGLPLDSNTDMVITITTVIFGLLGPHLVLGFYALRGSKIALWLGTLLFGVHELVTVSGLFGLPAPFIDRYPDPLQRWALYTLLAGLYLVQFMAFLIGLRARYQQR